MSQRLSKTLKEEELFGPAEELCSAPVVPLTASLSNSIRLLEKLN